MATPYHRCPTVGLGAGCPIVGSAAFRQRFLLPPLAQR